VTHFAPSHAAFCISGAEILRQNERRGQTGLEIKPSQQTTEKNCIVLQVFEFFSVTGFLIEMPG
jgi:hypothetical protein